MDFGARTVPILAFAITIPLVSPLAACVYVCPVTGVLRVKKIARKGPTANTAPENAIVKMELVITLPESATALQDGLERGKIKNVFLYIYNTGDK